MSNPIETAFGDGWTPGTFPQQLEDAQYIYETFRKKGKNVNAKKKYAVERGFQDPEVFRDSITKIRDAYREAHAGSTLAQSTAALGVPSRFSAALSELTSIHDDSDEEEKAMDVDPKEPFVPSTDIPAPTRDDTNAPITPVPTSSSPDGSRSVQLKPSTSTSDAELERGPSTPTKSSILRQSPDSHSSPLGPIMEQLSGESEVLSSDSDSEMEINPPPPPRNKDAIFTDANGMEVIVDLTTAEVVRTDSSDHLGVIEEGRECALAVLRVNTLGGVPASRCLIHIGKGGVGRGGKNKDAYQSPRHLECGCDSDFALLHLVIFKLASTPMADCRPLPAWSHSTTFSFDSLPFVDNIIRQTSGLTIDTLLQSKRRRRLTTAEWALKQLEEDGEGLQEEDKAVLRSMKLRIDALLKDK